MKFVKSSLALLLVFVMVLSLSGCHKKGEISLQIGEEKFTSGVYACALFFADQEARSKVSEQSSEEDAEEVTDIYAATIDEKDYVTWVEDKAVKTLSEYAVYAAKCKELELTLDEETKASVKNTVDSYWTYYQSTLEQNGIGKESFSAYLEYGYYADLYFKALYGENGSKAITKEELQNEFNANYKGVHMITAEFTEENKEEISEKLDGYRRRLKAGISFEVINKEYAAEQGQEIEEEEHDHAEGEAPKDELAQLIAKDEDHVLSDGYYTYASVVDYWDELDAMKKNDVIVKEDGSNLILIQLVDISGDEFYVKQFDSNLRSVMKQDEFEAEISAAAEALSVVKNASSMKQFNIKKFVQFEQ